MLPVGTDWLFITGSDTIFLIDWKVQVGWSGSLKLEIHPSFWASSWMGNNLPKKMDGLDGSLSSWMGKNTILDGHYVSRDGQLPNFSLSPVGQWCLQVSCSGLLHLKFLHPCRRVWKSIHRGSMNFKCIGPLDTSTKSPYTLGGRFNPKKLHRECMDFK